MFNDFGVFCFFKDVDKFLMIFVLFLMSVWCQFDVSLMSVWCQFGVSFQN